MSLREKVKEIIGNFQLVHDVRQIRNEVQRLRVETENLRNAAAILLLETSQRLDPRFCDPKRLLRFAHQVCSQNGEDGMIREIFRRIGEANRCFLEIGVGDGIENNSAFLLTQGWSGFWIDGSSEFMENVQCFDGRLKARTAFVTRENVNDLIAGLGVPSELDFFSLDIDQNTYHIWEAIENLNARVVVVEYNATLPPDLSWKSRYSPDRVWKGTANFGASLKAYEELAAKKGYALVGCDYLGVNAFFVRRDLLADHFAVPFSAENHYEPPRYSLSHRRGHRNEIPDAQPLAAQPGN